MTSKPYRFPILATAFLPAFVVIPHLALSLLWPYRDSIPLYFLVYSVGFVGTGCAVAGLRKRLIGWRWLVCLGLLLRVFWIPQEPGLSEDLYRYMWDGLLTIEGRNPYPVAPVDLEGSQQKHTELYSKMAHVDRTSIYPPVAQLFFLIGAAFGGASHLFWKVILLVSELPLWLLWYRRKLRPESVALWILNPLIIVEFYSSGHLDLLALALLMGSVLVLTGGGLPANRDLAAALLSAASLVKIFPAFLLPPQLVSLASTSDRVRFLLIFGSTSGFLILGFFAIWGLPWASSSSFLDILSTYRGIWRFNSLPFWLFSEHREVVLVLSEGLFGGTVLYLCWRIRPKSLHDIVTVHYFSMLTLFAVSHTVHPWYVSWGLVAYPVLGLRYWAILYLSAASFLSYLAYWFEPPGERAWVLWLEYVPYYVLAVRDVGALRERLALRRVVSRGE